MSYYLIEPNDRITSQQGAANIRGQAEIFADTVSDIPEPRTNWAVSSIAYVVVTGTFYMLNSSGTWINQDDFTELEFSSETEEAQGMKKRDFRMQLWEMMKAKQKIPVSDLSYAMGAQEDIQQFSNVTSAPPLTFNGVGGKTADYRIYAEILTALAFSMRLLENIKFLSPSPMVKSPSQLLLILAILRLIWANM